MDEPFGSALPLKPELPGGDFAGLGYLRPRSQEGPHLQRPNALNLHAERLSERPRDIHLTNRECLPRAPLLFQVLEVQQGANCFIMGSGY